MVWRIAHSSFSWLSTSFSVIQTHYLTARYAKHSSSSSFWSDRRRRAAFRPLRSMTLSEYYSYDGSELMLLFSSFWRYNRWLVEFQKGNAGLTVGWSTAKVSSHNEAAISDDETHVCVHRYLSEGWSRILEPMEAKIEGAPGEDRHLRGEECELIRSQIAYRVNHLNGTNAGCGNVICGASSDDRAAEGSLPGLLYSSRVSRTKWRVALGGSEVSCRVELVYPYPLSPLLTGSSSISLSRSVFAWAFLRTPYFLILLSSTLHMIPYAFFHISLYSYVSFKVSNRKNSWSFLTISLDFLLPPMHRMFFTRTVRLLRKFQAAWLPSYRNMFELVPILEGMQSHWPFLLECRSECKTFI